jgi:glycine cleavage system H lipoate-binding protein
MKYVVCHVWIRLLNSDAAQIASATEAQGAVEDHVVQLTQSVGRSLKAHLAM